MWTGDDRLARLWGHYRAAESLDRSPTTMEVRLLEALFQCSQYKRRIDEALDDWARAVGFGISARDTLGAIAEMQSQHCEERGDGCE